MVVAVVVIVSFLVVPMLFAGVLPIKVRRASSVFPLVRPFVFEEVASTSSQHLLVISRADICIIFVRIVIIRLLCDRVTVVN